MNNPLLLDIVTFLTTNGIVEGDGIDAFRDYSPHKPDSIVVLNEYKGEPAVPYDDNVHRSVQITVRDSNSDVARLKALQIYKLLKTDDLVVHFTSERWGQVHLRHVPIKIKEDENERVIWGFNVGITTTIE